MPTYAYKCEECETKYEVFHKVKEVSEDVKCPSCGSEKAKKLITAAGISGLSTSFPSVDDSPPMPSCASGMCGLN